MGFYIRKSVKAGPFRFTMSKSGLNVSAGIPGFRVGSGPRGNYVSVGRGGRQYRTTAHAQPRRQTAPVQPVSPPSDVVMEDVTGVTSMALQPTGGGDIVDQLNIAAARRGLGWPVAIAAGVVGLFLMPYGLILWLLATPLCVWLFLRDKARRTVVIFYDVGDAPAEWFDAMVSAWQWLTRSEKVWRVVQSGQIRTTHQHKTNAGASNLVSRVPVAVSLAGPKHLSTNVSVPSLTARGSSIHFLPDRVLVRDGKRYSDVAYDQLSVEGAPSRFIEGPGAVPRDAKQVDTTWQYVNVKGGPDRRYANNPKLPVMLYGALKITSSQGLYWRVQISREEAAPAVATTLSAVPGARS